MTHDDYTKLRASIAGQCLAAMLTTTDGNPPQAGWVADGSTGATVAMVLADNAAHFADALLIRLGITADGGAA